MSVTTSTKKRINVTFPESVLDLLESVVPARKRNAFIVEATEEALRRERQLACDSRVQRRLVGRRPSRSDDGRGRGSLRASAARDVDAA